MKLWIFENGLFSKAGHHFNNSVGLHRACLARGLAHEFFVGLGAVPEVLAALNARPVFRYTPYARASLDPLAGLLETTLIQGSSFAKGFDAALSQGLSSEDIVYVPTTTQIELYGCAVAMANLPPAGRPRLLLNFMMENFLVPGSMKYSIEATLYRYAMNALKPSIVNDRLVLAANGARMAEQLGKVLDRKVSVFPMPKHYPEVPQVSGRVKRSEPRICVAVLGHSRAEKGLHVVPPLIAAHPEFDFLIHVNGGMAAQQWKDAESQAAGLSNLEIVRGALDAEDYYALLARADVLLLPYDPAQIPFRSSGVFSEAVAAGKITVVPKGTWMEEHLAGGNGAGVSYEARTTSCISDALRLVASRLPELHAHAARCAPRWRAEQSIFAYVDQMLNAFGLAQPSASVET